MKVTLPLYLIAAAVIVIALQNAGIIKPLKIQRVQVVGDVDIGNTVDVDVLSPVDVNVRGPVDVNVDNTPLEVTLVR